MPRLQSVGHNAFSLLATLCSTPTPSGSEAALAPALESWLRRLGAEYRIAPVAGGGINVIAQWGEPHIIFTTHLDVVTPELPVSRDASTVRGRGAVDAKGQIAAQLAAIELLLEEGHTNLAWLGLAREETDSAGAAALADMADFFEPCRVIINGEPTGCTLATGQKGYLRARVSCQGRTAHGSTPELGRNAIRELMAWMEAFGRAEPAYHPRLGRESWNLGLIQGGRAANVVPDEAWAEISLRLVPDGNLRRALEESMPPSSRIEVLVDDPWELYSVPRGFARGLVPYGSDLPALKALAPLAQAVLAGPGNPALAHAEGEAMELSEFLRGVGLLHQLGVHYRTETGIKRGSKEAALSA